MPKKKKKRKGRIKQMKADHREIVGEYCPGAPDIGHAPHPCESPNFLTVDHIVPRSEGGTDAKTNLRVLCFEFNQVKADRNSPTSEETG